ncbi:Docking protein 1 [Bagarius yarrelli]|uniref:Docking protein 1 n=1 Tax=Bagarius yarrelli TaxID=175774 RepID=A0A556TVG4_BAGYA|nr:Docking protein 1 [Bagarius yarrelli]
MFGSYLLSPEKESLCLLDIKTGQVVFLWPYRFLRRFGQVKEGVTIEAGRRCQTGEGVFTFLSKQGQQIYRAIEEAIMHQRVQDLLSEATALSQDSMTPKSGPPAPQIGITRRNLALPPLPGPQPPALTSQSDSNAMVKPVRKLRNIPPPPALPELKPIETKPNRLDISNDQNQSSEWKPDTSDHQLYSKIKPRLHPRERKPDKETDQENPAGSHQSPVVANKPDLPKSFKEILSDVLFKDKTRPVPPSKPSSHSNLLADPDYYEIQ